MRLGVMGGLTDPPTGHTINLTINRQHSSWTPTGGLQPPGDDTTWVMTPLGWACIFCGGHALRGTRTVRDDRAQLELSHNNTQ